MSVARGARRAASRAASAVASGSLCRDNDSRSRLRDSRCGRFSPRRAQRLPGESVLAPSPFLPGPSAKQRRWADRRSGGQWRPRRPRIGPSRGSWRTRVLRLPLWWPRPSNPAGVSTKSWGESRERRPRVGLESSSFLPGRPRLPPRRRYWPPPPDPDPERGPVAGAAAWMRLRHRSGLAPPAWLPGRVILKKAGAMTLIVFFLLLKYTRICNIFKTNIWSLNFGRLGTLKNHIEVSKIHLLSFYYFLTSYPRYLKFFNNKNLFLAWDPFNIQSQANMRALHKKDPFPHFSNRASAAIPF